MLIVRGVNVFPSAVREVVSAFAPEVSGHILVKPRTPGVKQEPPLPVSVELARDSTPPTGLADAIRDKLRNRLIVQTRVDLVPWGTLQRSDTSRNSSRGSQPCESFRPKGSTTSRSSAPIAQTSIDFWEGVLGMPFVFEQPNLDNPSESHLYFDPGDGRLITIFTNEDRAADPSRTPTDPGCVHHIALSVSQATFHQAVERLDERGIRHSGVKDRGFMDSIYFEDPLGLLIELASYRFEPPHGYTHAEVLLEAHKLRVERGDYNIAPIHLADAIEALVRRSRASLSDDRSPKDPYQHEKVV